MPACVRQLTRRARFAAVGIPGIPPGSPLELFSWQIASVQLSQNNDVQELQCSIDGSNNLIVANGTGSIAIVSNAGTSLTTIKGSASSAPSSVAIDTSGNVWIANPTANSVDEVVGAAAPVTPLATAVQNNTLGAKP